MLVPPESSSAVLFIILSKSVSICNRSRARLVQWQKLRVLREYPNLMPSYGGLVEPKRSNLRPLKCIRLMPNISYAGCPGLSWMISAQFTLKMCTAAWNREQFTKTLFLGVQGRSRSSMLVPPESSTAVLVMISSNSVYICNRSNARLANSGKIRIS